MLTPRKDRVRLSGVMVLAAACFAAGLVAPLGALAKDGDNDRDDGGGRKCRGAISEAGVDPSGFPQPQMHRSHHGVLRTTLHACIATNTIVDQPSDETRQINNDFRGHHPGSDPVGRTGRQTFASDPQRLAGQSPRGTPQRLPAR
jgi:hypothetical protein